MFRKLITVIVEFIRQSNEVPAGTPIVRLYQGDYTVELHAKSN